MPQTTRSEASAGKTQSCFRSVRPVISIGAGMPAQAGQPTPPPAACRYLPAALPSLLPELLPAAASLQGGKGLTAPWLFKAEVTDGVA